MFNCLIANTQASRSEEGGGILTLLESLNLHLRHVNGGTDDGLLLEWNLEASVVQGCCVGSSQVGCDFDGVSVVVIVDDVDGNWLLCGVVDHGNTQVTSASLTERSSKRWKTARENDFSSVFT